MTANAQLLEAMQALYEAHSRFHEEWDKGPHDKTRWHESVEVGVERNRFWDAMNRLFLEHLDPLRASFVAQKADAVDEVIDFLSIDIPAFRCGYEKEWYLGKLKSISLNDQQRNRLKAAALALAGRPNYRRELRDWARLMIILADEQFIAELRELSNSDEHFVQQNARRMLETVLDNRQDLSGTNQACGI